MRRRALGILVLAACLGAWPGTAAAEPVSGPHGTLDQQFTTTQPGAPSGSTWDARYHAAGNPDAPPPYMRRMVFHNSAGVTRDTSVPDSCDASDAELALRGPDACPPGSRLGGGTTVTSFMGGPPTEVPIDLFNTRGGQFILARSPMVTTIARAKFHPDGSIEYASPTCFPSAPGVSCPVDSVLQLQTSMVSPPYTRTVDGVTRTYMTTPAKCPKVGHWTTPVEFWWADGSTETVLTKQPCTRPRAERTKRRKASRPAKRPTRRN